MLHKDLQIRRPEIDWLRIIAVLLLFPFHTAMIFFSKEDFYFKIPHSHPILDYFVLFLSPWHMPLLFYIAGISSYYSLKLRSPEKYIVERTERLLIPFIFGSIVIVPPQSYIAYTSKHNNNSILDFISFYFSKSLSDLTGYTGTFTPAHLWFILYLYFYSLLSARFFYYLIQKEKYIQTLLKPTFAYLTLIAYPVIIGLLDQLPTISTKNPFYYYSYFLIGFITPLWPKMEYTIFKHKKLFLFFGIITMLIYLYFTNYTFERYSTEDILYYILRRYNAWIWLLIAISCSDILKNYTPQFLHYLSESSYPIYIWHQTVIIITAYILYHIIPSSPLRFFVICLSLSIIFSFIIYHTFVRKIPLLRKIFGMKTTNQTSGEQ